jgi:hypothetical protein
MPAVRPTPFDLVFGDLAPDRFPAVRAELEAAQAAPRDRDSFLMARSTIQLVRELLPEEGSGEEVGQLAAFLHHAYLFWLAGTPTLELTGVELSALLGDPAEPGPAAPPPEFYVAFPTRRVWVAAIADAPPEPLDGCFLGLEADGSLSVLAALGLRPDRPGLSVAEVRGPRDATAGRADGSPLFGAALAGGDAAGLASVTDGAELLELGWRAWLAAGRHSGD